MLMVQSELAEKSFHFVLEYRKSRCGWLALRYISYSMGISQRAFAAPPTHELTVGLSACRLKTFFVKQLPECMCGARAGGTLVVPTVLPLIGGMLACAPERGSHLQKRV